jgi:MFS family permease
MLALPSVITYLDRVCVAVAGPRMQDGLHISPRAWGWVTGAFFLSYGFFEIPTGALGDRIGPRKVLFEDEVVVPQCCRRSGGVTTVGSARAVTGRIGGCTWYA